MGPSVLLEGLAELEGTWCRARGIVGGALGSMEGLMPTTPAQWNSGCHDLETLGERVRGGR